MMSPKERLAVWDRIYRLGDVVPFDEESLKMLYGILKADAEAGQMVHPGGYYLRRKDDRLAIDSPIRNQGVEDAVRPE